MELQQAEERRRMEQEGGVADDEGFSDVGSDSD